MTATATRAAKSAVSDVYDDCRGIIMQIAGRFSRSYGTDYQETLAAANLYFLEAYHTFEPDRGTLLEQRVGHYVRQRLLDAYRVQASRHAALPRLDVESLPPERTDRNSGIDAVAGCRDPRYFSLDEFGGQLSDSARTVLGLLFDSPPDLDAQIRSEREPSPLKIRKHLRRYCMEQLRWAAAQVRDAFLEIREALS